MEPLCHLQGIDTFAFTVAGIQARVGPSGGASAIEHAAKRKVSFKRVTVVSSRHTPNVGGAGADHLWVERHAVLQRATVMAHQAADRDSATDFSRGIAIFHRAGASIAASNVIAHQTADIVTDAGDFAHGIAVFHRASARTRAVVIAYQAANIVSAAFDIARGIAGLHHAGSAGSAIVVAHQAANTVAAALDVDFGIAVFHRAFVLPHQATDKAPAVNADTVAVGDTVNDVTISHPGAAVVLPHQASNMVLAGDADVYQPKVFYDGACAYKTEHGLVVEVSNMNGEFGNGFAITVKTADEWEVRIAYYLPVALACRCWWQSDIFDEPIVPRTTCQRPCVFVEGQNIVLVHPNNT